MHRFLMDHALMLPATFWPTPDGGNTWAATDGSGHRIDHIAVPEAWGPMVTVARVDESIDLSISRADHRRAVLELTGTIRGAA